MQANKRGIAVSEGTPLADLDSLQSRLVQHKDLLAAFAYAAEDTVHTWTIDSLTHSKSVLAEKAKQLKANPAAVNNAAKRAAQRVLAEASKQGTQASSSVAMQSDLAPYKQLLVERPAFSEEQKPLPQTPPQECNDTQARCSAELLAAGDLHKENDDRFNAITQALGDAAHQPVSTEDSSTQGHSDSSQDTLCCNFMSERQHDAFAVVQACILGQLHLAMRIICTAVLANGIDLCVHFVKLFRCWLMPRHCH